MYVCVQYAPKIMCLNLREEWSIAVVHINILKYIASPCTSIEWFLYSPLYTSNETLVHGTAIVEAWVCCSSSVLKFASTAMNFNVVCALTMYMCYTRTYVILAAKLLRYSVATLHFR